ncbi:MAG: DUF4350 domain-containing protein [Chitinophagaceae bacterium]|nr:DUF4350 domain-containing protein [Chitinophagaceae bacterium]
MTLFFKYIAKIILVSFIISGCNQQQKPRLPSLNETFKKDDKIPFGSFIAYSHFKKLFDDRFVEINDKPFDEAWEVMEEYSNEAEYYLYVLITKNLAVSQNEIDAILGFVREGNDMFIAADYIDDELLNRINCEEQRDSEIIAEAGGIMRLTSISMHTAYNNNSGDYKYFYYPFLNSFHNYDSVYTKPLGVNETGKPNYLVFFLGKGRLYLHAAPRSFSNYFLLTQNNYKYLENVLSYLRPEPKNIFWDEYYKNKVISRRKRGSGNGRSGNDNFSSLDVIKKYPSLLWAFWLSFATLIIYVLFNIKRRQRIINEIKPNVNTTMVFTETVGRLYLQKKDNKNISEKMITYFYEHIRNKYFMNTSTVNHQFVETLSRKTGTDITVTQQLFDTINQLQSQEQLTDVELLLLNEQVQNFYKNKN